MVVKLERKSERDNKRGRGTETGKQREGKGERLPQQKYFIPKRFLNAAMSVTQSWGQAIVLSCGFCRKADVRHESCSSYSFQLKTCICICKVYSTHTICTNTNKMRGLLCCSVQCHCFYFEWLSSVLMLSFEGCDRRVLECVVLLLSLFSLSLYVLPLLWLCVCVCVCVPSLVRCFGTKRKARPPHSLFCFL